MHDRLDDAGQSDATIGSLLDANLVRTIGLTAGALTLSWCLATSGRVRGVGGALAGVAVRRMDDPPAGLGNAA